MSLYYPTAQCAEDSVRAHFTSYCFNCASYQPLCLHEKLNCQCFCFVYEKRNGRNRQVKERDEKEAESKLNQLKSTYRRTVNYYVAPPHIVKER